MGSLRSLLPTVLLVAACNFDTSAAGPETAVNPFTPDARDPNAPDADPNAPEPAPAFLCSDWTVLPTILDPCEDISIELGTLSLTVLGNYRYNTNTGRLTDNLGVEVSHVNSVLPGSVVAGSPLTPRVLVTKNLYVAENSGLRVVGDRPLIIVAWSDMIVDGDIDVSSRARGAKGAGSNYPLCIAATPGTPGANGSGGGGGGGFGRAGGIGGLGRSPQEDNLGGLGGEAMPMQFHGGCAGADGGDDDSPSSAGAGAPSGGALYLLARGSLTLRGTLNAGGQGGLPSTGSRSGGGGGGSGGMLGLEANELNLEATASLVANGGGGGGGTDGDGEVLAEAGFDGSEKLEGSIGGAGEKSPKADGGEGGKLGNLLEAQNGILSDRGGGGGGGGYGYILLRTNLLMDDGALVSPAASTTSISAQ